MSITFIIPSCSTINNLSSPALAIETGESNPVLKISKSKSGNVWALRLSRKKYKIPNQKEKKALESYGKNLGLAFQIADDALDYYAKEKLFGKEIGKDFFEGKVTLPLISIFQKGNDKEKKFLNQIMNKEKRTEKDFSETLILINKYKYESNLNNKKKIALKINVWKF